MCSLTFHALGLYLNFQLPPAYRTRWWMLLDGILSAVILVVVAMVSGAGVWAEFWSKVE